MHSHAQFTIIGRIGRAEVEEFLADHKKRKSLVLSVATDDLRRKDEKDEPVPHWHRVTCYVPQVVQLADTLVPGRLVWLQGRIEQRSEGEGENRRYFTNLVADELGFLDPKAKAAGGAQAQAAE